MEKLLRYWREVTIVMLLVTMAFLAGRRWENRVMTSLIEQNSRLITLKLRTEAAISNSNFNTELKQAFANMGYNIQMEKQQ